MRSKIQDNITELVEQLVQEELRKKICNTCTYFDPATSYPFPFKIHYGHCANMHTEEEGNVIGELNLRRGNSDFKTFGMLVHETNTDLLIGADFGCVHHENKDDA